MVGTEIISAVFIPFISEPAEYFEVQGCGTVSAAI